MISCLEWVPKGAADPKPKRYEMSQVELEMLKHQAELEAKLNNGDDISDHDNDDDDDDSADHDEVKNGPKQQPHVKKNDLPDDLRMDEYSSDEDDKDVLQKILTGKSNAMIGTRIGENELPVTDIEEKQNLTKNDKNYNNSINYNGSDNDDDDDDDDDFDEIMEDTREYMPIDVKGLEAMGLANSSGPMYFAEDDDDEDDSDLEDTNLTPDDALIVVAKTDEDFASLQIHVYEQNTGNLFVHHDIPLPSFPLCMAHGDINNHGQAGNYVAVGTFSPGIEIWNLDVLDALEPICILGGEDTSMADELMKINMTRAAMGKKLKKKTKKKKGRSNQDTNDGGLKSGSHTDAIMALSWNSVHRQVIASGSADQTVKLWDITRAGNFNGNPKERNDTAAPAATFSHHRDKVNAVVWHPSEGTLLATGSFDRTVALLDVRAGDENTTGNNIKTTKIPADCEALAWDPFQEQFLTAASEDGTITCWDVRKFDEPYWSFVAHEFGGVSDLSYNRHVPGFFATCAVDKTVALWDVQNVASLPNKKPYSCGIKEMNVGKLFSVSFYPSSPWLLGSGGNGNSLALWDLSNEKEIQQRFADRVDITATTAQSEMQSGNLNDTNEISKETDFEAIMSANDAVQAKTRQEVSKQKGKNKKKNKKKTHKRRA